MSKVKAAQGKPRRSWPFFLGMFLYALIFLTALYFALGQFWTYMEAYENSRPKNTLNAFIDQLDGDDVILGSGELLSRVDSNLQSEEECREVLLDAVSDGITYAKRAGDSNAQRMVYSLRSVGQTIGSLTMEVTSQDRFGFNLWQVTHTEFDLSYLLGSRASITVPEDFSVYAHGTLLDSSYITQSGIPYPELASFYGDYHIPSLVTYEAGPILGNTTLRVTNPTGDEITIDESTDYMAFLDNCSEETEATLESFSKEFLRRYIAFTGSAKKSSAQSFKQLNRYLVPNSDLAKRMSMALAGMQWAQSQGDTLVDTTFHHMIDLGNGYYLCDVTYQVDTIGHEGVVRTTNSARFIILDTNGVLRVETLFSY